MLAIAGTMSLDPAKRELAIAAMRELMVETRKEPGCISYTFTANLEDAGTFHVFEEWKSQQDVDAHIKSPHMARFQKAVPTLGFRGMKLQRYEISSVGPLR